MTIARPSAVVAVSLVALVSVGACSSSRVLDPDELSALVEQAVVDGIGVTPSDIECPEVVDPDDGETFECTVTIEGQSLRMAGTVTDAAEGSVEVANAQAVIIVEQLETIIADDAAAQTGITLAVECGDGRVRVADVGDTLTCDATDPAGDTLTVEVEVLDVEGNVNYSVG